MKCLLDLAAKHNGPILELACGGGRATKELAKRGYEIYGLDASEPMLKLATEEIRKLSVGEGKVHLIRGDMTNFEIKRKFSFVFIAFISFWYNLGESDAEKCLREIVRHMKKGGEVFIDSPTNRYPYPNSTNEFFKTIDDRFREQMEWWNEQAKKYGLSLRCVIYDRNIYQCLCQKQPLEHLAAPCYLGLENINSAIYYKTIPVRQLPPQKYPDALICTKL